MTTRNYFLVLFAIKPFIDMLVGFKFPFGPKDLSALDIMGVLTFLIVLLGLYEATGKFTIKVLNQKLIFIFLFIVAGLGIVHFVQEQKPLYELEVIIRISTPYLIYLFFHYFLSDEKYKRKLIKTVWISHLAASLISIFFYFFTVGKYDISQHVFRYSGFYGDAMTFSLVAVTSAFFGIYYYEMMKQKNQHNLIITLLYYLTLIVCSIIIVLTITKITIIISFVFVLAWWGIYKKRKLVIVPLLILIAFYAFEESGRLQKRFAAEISVFETLREENNVTFYDARGFGSGRFGRWINAYNTYMYEYSAVEQWFGSYRLYSVHNQYFGYLLQIGIVGLAAFLIMLSRFYWLLIKRYLKTKNFEFFLALLLLNTVVVIGFGYMSFNYTGFLWLCFILISNLNVKQLKQPKQIRRLVRMNDRIKAVYAKT